MENKIKEEEEARAAAGGDASSSQEEMLGLKELASQELAQIETMIGDLLEWLQIDEDLSTLGLPEPELEQLDGAPDVTAQQTGGGERAKEALKKRGAAAGAKKRAKINENLVWSACALQTRNGSIKGDRSSLPSR